jgi:hypothetical protein
MKFFCICLLLGMSLSFGQLVQKKPAPTNDTVNLSGQTHKMPMVYSDSLHQKNNKAASGAIASVNKEEEGDALTGAVIGVGAEFVGQVLKDMISPNSPEADAVELERTRR